MPPIFGVWYRSEEIAPHVFINSLILKKLQKSKILIKSLFLVQLQKQTILKVFYTIEINLLVL